MNEFTISSKVHGKVTFSVPSAKRGYGYVYVDLNGGHGTLGDQICNRGSLIGSTVSCSPESLETVARSWYRAYMRNHA